MYILHNGQIPKDPQNGESRYPIQVAYTSPILQGYTIVAPRLANCLMERCGRCSRRMPESLTGRAACATAKPLSAR